MSFLLAGVLNSLRRSISSTETSPSPPPTTIDMASEERRVVEGLLRQEKSPSLGETWYVVSAHWWTQWRRFVGLDKNGGETTRPTAIDNTDLIDPLDLRHKGPDNSPRVRMTAVEELDFVLCSADVWNELHRRYGGGPAIPRKVLIGRTVEVFPQEVYIYLETNLDTPECSLFVPRVASIGSLKHDACERLNRNEEDTAVWLYDGAEKVKQALVEDELQTLFELDILDDSASIVLGKRPAKKAKESPQFVRSESSLLESAEPLRKRQRQPTLFETSWESPKAKGSPNQSGGSQHFELGLCGLINLGNTCFMNSSLQCLSNTSPLCNFLVSGDFRSSLNRENVLGTKGELTTAFAHLLGEMWSGRMSSVAPRDFKWKLERFAPQFSGWQQHDSHELLAFLLDGLHEDLNRVTKKPYFETNEFEGLPEVEAALKSWGQHIARNNSFVTDWFHGLLRSELNCNVCPRISKVFDPFMYLSVPLPVTKTCSMSVLLWDTDMTGARMLENLIVPKDGDVSQLADVVAKAAQLDARNLVFMSVSRQSYARLVDRQETLSTLESAHLACFDIVGHEEEHGPQVVLFTCKAHVGQQQQPLSTYSSWISTSSSLYSREETVLHVALGVPRDVKTNKQLYEFVWRSFLTHHQVLKKQSSQTSRDVLDAAGKPSFHLKANFYRIPDNDDVLTAATKLELTLDGDYMRKGVFDVAALRKIHQELVQPKSINDRSEEAEYDLLSCIQLFTAKEQLSAEDPWFCSVCKEHRRAYKKFDLWRLPKILIVQLKRFSYMNRHWRDKIEGLVKFPLTGLDLTSVVKGPIVKGEEPVYDLFAVSNHYGSLGGGHYTAFCKNVKTGKWHSFDDSRVSEVDEANIVTPAAYVLFYQRRDVQSEENEN